MSERQIRLHAPTVGDQQVSVRWTCSPPSELWLAEGFELVFGPELDVLAVPSSLWPRLAMICLFAQWALLAPCRVQLPFYLPPPERRFWMRLCATAVEQLRAYGMELPPGATVSIDGGGPLLAPPPRRAFTVPGDDQARVAAAFSGGKDSLLQAALLAQLTERPLLVTTTSPVLWANDHLGAARRRALSQITQRLAVELVEVRCDFRAGFDNSYPSRHGCALTVNELCDVALYQAVTLAAASARGCSRAFLASEAELQYNAPAAGRVIQHGHFTCSSATQMALSAMLEPFGLRLGSLLYPLHMHQVQALLWRCHRELADLQFSCWLADGGQQACSRCGQCLIIALAILAEGFSPTPAGIDPAALFEAFADPPPPAAPGQTPPRLHPRRSNRDHFRRTVAAITPERLSEILAADPLLAGTPRLARAIDAYRRLRARVGDAFAPPAPGYIEGFIELIDADLRAPLRATLASNFAPDDGEFDEIVSRARSLARWTAYPLRAGWS
jgi:hypothetical protein